VTNSRHLTNSAPSTDTQPDAELIGFATPTVAIELRRRRELLGWSQAETARRSAISRTVINEIEAGNRMPHTGTYQKLRAALGLSLPTAQAAGGMISLGRSAAPKTQSDGVVAIAAPEYMKNASLYIVAGML
jgi:transcriptional regulator with XRE-family HTH domain